MPTYVYVCERCGNQIEEVRSIHKPHRSRCPDCGAKDPTFHQDFTQHRVNVVGSPTTVGQQMERNEKRFGKELMQKKVEATISRRKRTGRGLKLPEGARVIDASDAPIPWYRDGSVPGTKKLEKPLNINKMSDTQKEKYIHTGEI